MPTTLHAPPSLSSRHHIQKFLLLLLLCSSCFDALSYATVPYSLPPIRLASSSSQYFSWTDSVPSSLFHSSLAATPTPGIPSRSPISFALSPEFLMLTKLTREDGRTFPLPFTCSSTSHRSLTAPKIIATVPPFYTPFALSSSEEKFLRSALLLSLVIRSFSLLLLRRRRPQWQTVTSSRVLAGTTT